MVVWTNIFSLTILVTLCAILGVVVTSAAQVIYGVSTWSPLQVSSLMGNRAAQFFSAFMWALAVLSTNISANSTAVGNDLMVMLPKWINIRRGQYITAILGLVTCPWIIQNSAKTFTAFLGGYSVFLAPVGGVLMTDFLFVHGRRISLPDLYVKRESVYWYTHGWNLRAVAAFVLGVVPTLPGFIRNVNGKLGIPVGASYLFCVVYPVGVVVSGSFYLLFCTIWPVTPVPVTRAASSGSNSFDDESMDKEKDASASVGVLEA